jgi:hypothetical protein
MGSLKRRSILAAFASVALCPGASLAQHAPGVQQVLNRARAASGGAAWTALRGLHETGTENGAPYERWLDALRYGDRLTVQAPTERRQGYNGYGVWWRPQASRTDMGPDHEVLARARSDAFFAAYGYYFSGRFDLRSGYVGVREAGGRRFTVVWVQPAGGEARDLWFDQGTGLLGRIVDRAGQRPRTVEVSDYRRVGKLLLPFRQVAYGGGLTKPSERRIARIETLAPDRALFSLPR